MYTESLSNFYIGILSIQITLGTILAGGMIALYQLNDKQSPKRQIGKVVHLPALVAYFVILFLLITGTAAFTWSQLGAHDLLSSIDLKLNDIAASQFVTIIVTVLSVGAFVAFFWFLWRSRILIEPKSYLKHIAGSFRLDQLSDYLFHSYSNRPWGYVLPMMVLIGKKPTKKQKAEHEQKEEDTKQVLAAWDKRYQETSNTTNPLALFEDYCRINAVSSSSEVVTVGLPLFEGLLLSFVTSEKEELPEILRYLDDVTLEFKESFTNSSILVHKRYLDLLTKVTMQLLESKDLAGMESAAKLFHVYTKGPVNEEVKKYAVSQLRDITRKYSNAYKDEKDWRNYYPPYEQLFLIGARIGEDYYHNLNELAPVSVIESNLGETDDVTGELVEFFAKPEPLERYKDSDALPIILFDAVSVTADALMSAMQRSRSVKQNLGMSISRYSGSVNTLYWVPYDFARFAVKHHNKSVLKSTVYQLIKGLKSSISTAPNVALDMADNLVSLGFQIACSDEIKNLSGYDDGTLVDNIIDAVNSFPDHAALTERKSGIIHNLFEIQFEPEFENFQNRIIGW